jgi:hypothetical protein
VEKVSASFLPLYVVTLFAVLERQDSFLQACTVGSFYSAGIVMRGLITRIAVRAPTIGPNRSDPFKCGNPLIPSSTAVP